MNTGCLFSPFDHRDHQYYPRSRAPLPGKIDLRKLLPPIQDQGKTSKCVAYSGVAIKYFQEQREHNKEYTFEPDYIYERRMNDGNGMYGRDLFDIMKKYGCARELVYKSPDSSLELIDKDAQQFKIINYAKLYDVIDVKTALYNDGPVYMATKCYNNSKYFWLPEDGETTDSGHATVLCGYDDTEGHFIVRNSWGTDWADKGYSYMKYDDLKCAYELFVCYDAKCAVSVKTPPPPVEKAKCCLIS